MFCSSPFLTYKPFPLPGLEPWWPDKTALSSPDNLIQSKLTAASVNVKCFHSKCVLVENIFQYFSQKTTNGGSDKFWKELFRHFREIKKLKQKETAVAEKKNYLLHFGLNRFNFFGFINGPFSWRIFCFFQQIVPTILLQIVTTIL